MFDSWEFVCSANKLISTVPLSMAPAKNNYPQDLPEWYTENDDMVGVLFPEDLFFDPYITIKEEMKQLEKYEYHLECVSDDESDDVSDYEWEMIKNKF
tara:strand:- start:1764 stop:2057 length:294 start_codon:yes stop_codon:yes gene_type:complete